MSRSRKKSPFAGYTTCESEAAWKAQVARRTRRAVHQTLGETLDGDALPERRCEVANPYEGPKDGKQRFSPSEAKWMRK